VSNESTPQPLPEPEEPSGDDAATETAEAGTALPRGFLAHFARANVPGTELTIRAPSARQASDSHKDAASEDLDDREFTVALVQRQLDQELSLEDVRAWDDEQLLDAADAYLLLNTEGEEAADVEEGAQEPADGEADDDETEPKGDVEPEPLTFASFRNAIREQGARRAKRMTELFDRISTLTTGALSPSVAAAMKGIAGVDFSKITGSFASNALAGIDLKALAGTSAMGDSLRKMMADTQAVQKFALPAMSVPRLDRHVPAPEPLRTFTVAPVVRPEIGLLREVNESLEKMHDDQLRFDEHQIEVLTQQGELLKAQGAALEALVIDAKGQKWNRLITIVATIVMTVATVVAVLFAAGLLHAAGTTSPGSPAPVASAAPAAPSSSPVTSP